MPAAQTEHRRDTHDDGVNAADDETTLKFAQTWQPVAERMSRSCPNSL